MKDFSKATKKILAQSGYSLLRTGKGDHEIWHHRETGKRITVDAAMKSRHTANAVLKRAGLPKAF